MVVECVPTGIGDIEETPADDDPMGGVAEGRSATFDDGFRRDTGERRIEAEHGDAFRGSAVLRSQEFPFVEIEAVDTGQCIFALRIEPPKCAIREIEDGNTASVVGDEE